MTPSRLLKKLRRNERKKNTIITHSGLIHRLILLFKFVFLLIEQLLYLEFAGPVGSGFLTKFGPTGPVAVATKSKFLATATATAKNR